jgi:carbonic anhydrase
MRLSLSLIMLSLFMVPVAYAADHPEGHAADAHPVAASDAAHEGKPSGEPGAAGQAVLERLMIGNRRFVANTSSLQHRDADRRAEIAKGQHPVAIVVCCSDSRVPPEQVFDVGLGDIFVVRLAGNVVDPLALGSIEYAAEHLHVPLVVVLGHERCGAVTAAVGGGQAPGHLLPLVETIQANLATMPPPAAGGDLVDQGVRANAQAVAHQISGSIPILKEMVKAGELAVVAARYDLESGVVEVLP